jgi:hypothetical protein
MLQQQVPPVASRFTAATSGIYQQHLLLPAGQMSGQHQQQRQPACRRPPAGTTWQPGPASASCSRAGRRSTPQGRPVPALHHWSGRAIRHGCASRLPAAGCGTWAGVGGAAGGAGVLQQLRHAAWRLHRWVTAWTPLEARNAGSVTPPAASLTKDQHEHYCNVHSKHRAASRPAMFVVVAT